MRTRFLKRLSAQRRPGFTLIEIIVALALLSVAAAVIVPRMGRSLSGREIREAAGRFAQMARAVRELAVARGRVVVMEVDLDKGGYAIAMQSSAGGGELRPVQASWLKGAKWPEAIRRSEFRTFEGASAAHGQHRVNFNADGTTSGGMLRFSGEDDEQTVVVIYPHTGRVAWGDPRELSAEQEMRDLGD